MISVDTKKKELIGKFRNGGREWQPKGVPDEVLVHDFLDKTLGKAIPYGVYDLTKNEGWVSVGIDHDTAHFATEANEVFWSTFLDNANFFTLANGNLEVGADTNLTVDGLTTAETKFLERIDADGKPIGIDPKILLVPVALGVPATQLMTSLEIRDNLSGPYPTTNPHTGKFRVVRSAYLSSPSFAGSSRDAWYLLADPNDLPLIEVAFLNGQEQPTIEHADADFSVLGVQMRGFHDFGVSLQDHRGGVKMAGM